jgi:hypothetical protein
VLAKVFQVRDIELVDCFLEGFLMLLEGLQLVALMCVHYVPPQQWQVSLEVFSDIKTRVPEVMPSERNSANEFLVCYCYPAPEQGPGNQELQQVRESVFPVQIFSLISMRSELTSMQVILHHRKRRAGSLHGHRCFSAPLLLYLPPQVAQPVPEDLLPSGKYSIEYVVRDSAGKFTSTNSQHL